MGNELATRRVLRLGGEDNLTNDSYTNNLISSTLKNPNIEKYWADELMVAIFKSEDCSSFFNKFKNNSLENDSAMQYLSNHAHKMDYKTYLEKGYPISTGLIKGCCGHLIKDRMESSGTRWATQGA